MKKRFFFWVAVSILVMAVIACQFAGVVPTAQPPLPTETLQPTAIPSPISQDFLIGEQDSLIALYEQVSPGVVAIIVFTADGGGLGSGWVFNSDGYIVTNYHVVEGATKVEIDFPSGYKTYGSVVGADPASDLAVIKVDVPAEELHPLTLGDSDQLKVGQVVVAIGNPFGLYGTMTLGIVSALGRSLESEKSAPGGGYFSAGDIIQTDAALNPGNSGGPLLTLTGEVVGVNRAIRTTNFTAQGEPLNTGVGFAISINIVKRIVPVLIAQGTYQYPYLGVSSRSDLTLPEIEALGLNWHTGAYVTSVVIGGPADRAGLRAGTHPTSIEGLKSGGDLIIAIDGRSVLRFDDLLRYLYNNKFPDDTVVLTVLREGQPLDIVVTLGVRP